MKTNNPIANYGLFVFCCLFFLFLVAENSIEAVAGTIPVKVGVVLDLDTWVGKLGLSCINMALSDFYSHHSDYKTRLVLNIRDSKRNVIGAAVAALDLIKNVQVQAIIGPENSMQTNFVIDLGNKSQVPIISFSATSHFLTSIRNPYFFRIIQNDSSQVDAISAVVEAFGWREIVPIYVENGEETIPYLFDSLAEIGAQIRYRSVISSEASDEEIEDELYKLRRMLNRVFIVHSGPELGIRIFRIAKEIGMMSEGYVWIVTSGMIDLLILMDDYVMDSMQGVLGIRSYVPKSQMLENFKVRWRKKFQQEDNPEFDVVGLKAYDATFALAMAVEKSSIANNFTNFVFDVSSHENATTDLESLGVSRSGSNLIEALSGTRFRGISGEFGLLNGQLNHHSSVFEIINVNENGGRGIGFWTSKNGLVRTPNFTKPAGYSMSKENLGPIIWPGDSLVIPKGSETLGNGKKLRIGVPVKKGFNEFVNVRGSNVTGYCIDIFKAVMDAMPYNVSYDFHPFANADGVMVGSYDDLIYQVYLGKYDAVVGDVTISANRLLYADFTLPYTESRVVMVVPTKNYSHKKAWVFLKPLTWELWATSGCFFVFIGIVVWLLEHRVNEDFRGPPSHHIGTSFWFSLSTMVFTHRERVVSNPARFLVVIWCFVVFVLTQSYTASLTSLLTVQQLRPTEVNNMKYVAYQNSYVLGLLKQLGFDRSKMKEFGSPKELDELFSKGIVEAAFDEIPYMKLFLASYCNKYTIVEPSNFKTSGFGFVFPKDSPLVADVSRATLYVTEGDKAKEIENEWFQESTSCLGTSKSTSSLDVGSFWGLFLIAGVAGILAILIFAADFLYQQRNILLDSSKSAWNRIIEVGKILDDKDLTYHTMRKNKLAEGSCRNSPSVVEGSPGIVFPPSPSSSSDQTDSSVVHLGDQGGLSSTSDHQDINVIASSGIEIQRVNST